jgi:NADH-quinone oxidoreductase subunit A
MPHDSLHDYLPLALVLAFAILVGSGQVLLATVLGWVRKSRTNVQPYECGMEPIDANRKRLSIKYYMVAVLFLIFDLETIFIFPWALKFKEMTTGGQTAFALAEMGLFLAFLFAGYLYIIKRRALEWD